MMQQDRLLTAAKIVFALGVLFGFTNFRGEVDPVLLTTVLLAAGLVSGALAAVRADVPRATNAVLLPLLGFALTLAFC